MNNEIVKVIDLGITEEKLNELKDKFSKVADASTKAGYILLKEEKKELTKYISIVESERKIQVRSALDHNISVNKDSNRIKAIIESFRQPRVDAIKFEDEKIDRVEKEKIDNELRRISRIKSEIAYIVDYKVEAIEMSSDELNQAIKEMEIARIRENGLDEFYDDFKAEAETTVSYLNKLHEQALKNEAYKKKMEEMKVAQDKIDVENKKIEEEKVKIAQKQREEQIREEEKARSAKMIIELEEKAKLDKIEAEKQAEIAKEQIIADKIAAELHAKERIESAKRLEAEKIRLEIDKTAKIEAAEEARKALKLKQERENKLHIKKINTEALQSLMDNGMSEANAKKVIKLIAKKIIKNITINY